MFTLTLSWSRFYDAFAPSLKAIFNVLFGCVQNENHQGTLCVAAGFRSAFSVTKVTPSTFILFA